MIFLLTTLSKLLSAVSAGPFLKNSELSKIKLVEVHHGAETAQKVERRKRKVDQIKKRNRRPDLSACYSR